MMRNALLTFHLWGAVVAGAFLVILGLTGAIMTFEDDLDRMFNPRLFTVAVGSDPLPVATVLAGMRQHYPGQRFGRVQLPTRRDAPYIGQAGKLQVFVNGYSGEIVGTRTTPTFLGLVHQCHTSLLLGATGRTLVTVATVMLVLLVGSGVYLWWPLKRATVRFAIPGRPLSFDLHNALGIYAAPLLLLLALTGVAIAFSDALVPWLYTTTHSTPPLRDVASSAVTTTPPIGPDEALRVARQALPGATPIALSSPTDARASYSVALRFPEDLTPGGRSWVIIDQYRSEVLFVENSRIPPTATGMVTLNRAIHTGDVFGYPSKVAMALASLALVAQTITGGWLWWKRRRRLKSLSAHRMDKE